MAYNGNYTQFSLIVLVLSFNPYSIGLCHDITDAFSLKMKLLLHMAFYWIYLTTGSPLFYRLRFRYFNPFSNG